MRSVSPTTRRRIEAQGYVGLSEYPRRNWALVKILAGNLYDVVRHRHL